MKISHAAKVGILTLASTVIFLYGVMWLKGRSMSTAERIEVNFHDVDGMRPGSAVQIMGIRVGQVEEVFPVIEKDDSFVKVKFVITEPSIDIPQASIISIQQSGIIGEKFLEITPPQIQTYFLPVDKDMTSKLKEKDPVFILADGHYIKVGEVKKAEVIDKGCLPPEKQRLYFSKFLNKINYILTTPGVILPEDIKAEIRPQKDNKGYKLYLSPPENIIVKVPESGCKYTVVDPMRLQKFLDLQLKAAESLKETNDKINELLTAETLDDLQIILKNTKNLTAEAAVTLKEANILISESKKDISSLIVLAKSLSENMISLTDNINDLVGDKELKNNLMLTAQSVQTSSQYIEKLLSSSKLEQTLTQVNNTAGNLPP